MWHLQVPCFFRLCDKYLAEGMIGMTSFRHIMEQELCEVVIVCGEGVLVVKSLQCGEYKTCEDVSRLA